MSRPQGPVSEKEADLIFAAVVHLLSDLRQWQRDDRRRPDDHKAA